MSPSAPPQPSAPTPVRRPWRLELRHHRSGSYVLVGTFSTRERAESASREWVPATGAWDGWRVVKSDDQRETA